jgi:hypothetical protein
VAAAAAGGRRGAGGTGAEALDGAEGGRDGDGAGIPDDGLDALRAACVVGWAAADAGRPVRRIAGDRPAGCAEVEVPG